MSEVEKPKSLFSPEVARFFENLKLTIAFCVVTVLVLVVFAGVALGYCILEVHPVVNFILLSLALTLLAYVEALHYSVIAIEKWDMLQYEDKYPRAVKCWKLVDNPVNVKKFIVGRQFFVIFVVFLIAQITSFPHIPSNFVGLPPTLVLVLLQTGLPGVALVLTYGQLVSQLYVEEFTLQFMNLYGCEFCIRLSLGAEFVGVCNFSWLLFHASARSACGKVREAKKIIKQRRSQEALNAMQSDRSTKDATTGDEDAEQLSKNDPNNIDRGAHFETGLSNKIDYTWFDYLKFLWSTCATLGSVGIILYGISIEAYVLPVNVAGAYIIALLMMANLFFLEGLMIAIVGTQYWDPEAFQHAYPRAYKVHKLVNQPDNVKRFIIGRQFFTVLTNFLLAQIFTFANWEDQGWDPVLFYIVIKSGLVGVLTVLAFSQLMPELLAAEYPLRFMDLYYSYSIVCISLVLDFLGVGHCAWAVYFATQYFFCKHHEPTPEEKAAKIALETKPEFLRVESAEILAHDIEAASGVKRKNSFSFLSPSSKSNASGQMSPKNATAPSGTGSTREENVGLEI